jgi:hypothetical protein
MNTRRFGTSLYSHFLVVCLLYYHFLLIRGLFMAGPIGRAVYGVGLRPLAC